MENKDEKQIEVIQTKDIQVVQPSPMEVAQSLIVGGADITVIKEFISMQREHDAYEAKKAYTKAMAAFKANPPVISKDKSVSYNQTNYKHASLGNVTGRINSALGKHGLSAAWPLEQRDKFIKVTCTITHELGHSESTFLEAVHDSSGSKNPIQAMGSTISYLQRYTILALTGLATEDQDDDGQTAELQYINEKQVSIITDMINSIEKADEGSFCKWAKIESIALMPVKDFNNCLSALKAM